MATNRVGRRTKQRRTFEVAVLADSATTAGMVSNILGTRAQFDTERELGEFFPNLLRLFRRGFFGQPTPGDEDVRGLGALVYRWRGLTEDEFKRNFPDLAREAVEPIPAGSKVHVEIVHRPHLAAPPAQSANS